MYCTKHQEHIRYENLEYGGNIEYKQLLHQYHLAQFMIIYDLSKNKEGEAAGFFPSKLAELIATKKPILFIGNLTSKAARLISELNIGICTTNESSEIADAINKVVTGIEKRQFSLALTEEKRQLIDSTNAEHAFVEMLSEVQN